MARVDLDRPDPGRRLLAGRMEALRGWERIGWARRRDYATERLGISGRRLEELARMDRAFASGRLSWTKARLLARVADPGDADAWIERASTLTARELSREVRALDAQARDLLLPETDEDGASEDDAKETVFVRCTPAVRAKWHRARFLASRQAGHPVPAWAVAEQIAAEALSAFPLDAAALDAIGAERARTGVQQGGDASPAPASAGLRMPPHDPFPNGCADQRTGSEPASRTSKGASPAEALAPGSSVSCVDEPAWLATLVEALDEADAFDLDGRLRRALEAERQLEARMGAWLLAVARGRLYRSLGHTSLGSFAREWLGLSPSKADALVRLERACAVVPPLRRAYREGRLSWAQAQLLLPLLRREECTRWQAAWVAHAERVSVRRLGDEVSLALARERFEPPPLDPPQGCWSDGGDPAEERGADSQTGAHATYFPKSMAFFFTAPRDVARLFRGEHAKVVRCRGRAPGRLRFEFGLRPGRTPLARYRSGDVVARAGDHARR